MRSVRSMDTAPERRIRTLLHKLGYRFRLHNKNLPGKPDIVLPKYRTVIFVHGCFWHRHKGCPHATTPSSRQYYWLPKFNRTIQRDKKNQAVLREQGLNVVVVWECETRDLNSLADRLIMKIGREAMPSLPSNSLSIAAEHTSEYKAKK